MQYNEEGDLMYVPKGVFDICDVHTITSVCIIYEPFVCKFRGILHSPSPLTCIYIVQTSYIMEAPSRRIFFHIVVKCPRFGD